MFVPEGKLQAAVVALRTKPGYPSWALLEEIDRLFNQSKTTATPPNYANGYQDALRELVTALAERLPALEAR